MAVYTDFVLQDIPLRFARLSRLHHAWIAGVTDLAFPGYNSPADDRRLKYIKNTAEYR
ncbi:MAG: hypothetical protein OEW04_06165 [Nitrospirota bacterium]|nr:hypothetical protein [Nitrospirota bacterium]